MTKPEDMTAEELATKFYNNTQWDHGPFVTPYEKDPCYIELLARLRAYDAGRSAMVLIEHNANEDDNIQWVMGLEYAIGRIRAAMEAAREGR